MRRQGCVWVQQGMSYPGDACSDATSRVTPQQSCRDYAIAVPALVQHGFIHMDTESWQDSAQASLGERRRQSWCEINPQETYGVQLGPHHVMVPDNSWWQSWGAAAAAWEHWGISAGNTARSCKKKQEWKDRGREQWCWRVHNIFCKKVCSWRQCSESKYWKPSGFTHCC